MSFSDVQDEHRAEPEGKGKSNCASSGRPHGRVPFSEQIDKEIYETENEERDRGGLRDPDDRRPRFENGAGRPSAVELPQNDGHKNEQMRRQCDPARRDGENVEQPDFRFWTKNTHDHTSFLDSK